MYQFVYFIKDPLFFSFLNDSINLSHFSSMSSVLQDASCIPLVKKYIVPFSMKDFHIIREARKEIAYNRIGQGSRRL